MHLSDEESVLLELEAQSACTCYVDVVALARVDDERAALSVTWIRRAGNV